MPKYLQFLNFLNFGDDDDDTKRLVGLRLARAAGKNKYIKSEFVISGHAALGVVEK